LKTKNFVGYNLSIESDSKIEGKRIKSRVKSKSVDLDKIPIIINKAIKQLMEEVKISLILE
jgi:hypothetical protein